MHMFAQNETYRKPTAAIAHSPDTAGIAVAVLFACFLSTGLFVRHTGADALVLTHYTSRIVEIAFCFLIAFVARSSRINPYRLFQAGACSLFAYLALQGCKNMIPSNLFDEQAMLIDSFAGVFNGILTASMVLLFARAFSALSSRHAIVLIPSSWALAHLIFLGSRLLPSPLIGPIELVLLFLSSTGLYFALKHLVPEASFKGVIASRKENLALLPLLKSNRYFSLYFGMLIFPFFYGIMAQVCAYAGVRLGPVRCCHGSCGHCHPCATHRKRPFAAKRSRCRRQLRYNSGRFRHGAVVLAPFLEQ